MHLDKGKYSGQILEMKEYAGFITSKTGYTGNHNTEFHYHENPHLSFILQGGNYEYKKSRSSVKNIGEVLFYHSGELHKTIPTDPATRNLNLEIDINFLKANFTSETELKNAVEKNINRRLFMLKVHSELLFNDAITETAIQALLLNIVKDNKTNKYKTVQWADELNNILNDEWNKNHSLSELSRHLSIHPVTISKNFNKYFGCTYGNYVRKLRIDRSLQLIKNPNYTLTEIAFICGFADQSHFIRAFKSYTGLNPKYFQKL